ncbi:MAG TPA: hypothetical protein VK934_01575, partial [Fimbriimonas sp.]|nr:hypothetical protein [Fimbriimonas sp.]
MKSRIVEASVFKSGLVMLTREVQIPAGEGLYKLDVLPEAIDGTFWYRSADGLTIGDVETKLRIKDRQEKVKVSSMYDLL